MYSRYAPGARLQHFSHIAMAYGVPHFCRLVVFFAMPQVSGYASLGSQLILFHRKAGSSGSDCSAQRRRQTPQPSSTPLASSSRTTRSSGKSALPMWVGGFRGFAQPLLEVRSYMYLLLLVPCCYCPHYQFCVCFPPTSGSRALEECDIGGQSRRHPELKLMAAGMHSFACRTCTIQCNGNTAFRNPSEKKINRFTPPCPPWC